MGKDCLLYTSMGAEAYLFHSKDFDDYFYLLPEDMQAQINARANEQHFHSEEELRAYVKELAMRA